ncbi:protein FliW [Leptospira borgpetersenii serovar Pomona str. 200901868]|uniref:Flagellar assembly factor FliW n=1 Tax=Leptospira borgpetersenii serovar Pomona str. 200901868 TaxID=1192866 RepID=M6W1L8_LEPBO|nr:protein FliW [Leptospira borgpetersenii serovar Pomona str. 200901868]
MQISEKQILSFPEGLLGFEDYKKFALIEEKEESVFKWLQSVEEVDLAFVVIPPSLFKKEYKPLIPEQELQGIGITDLEDGLMLVIVTVPGEDPALMTANMQGPILINKKTLLGKQFISRNESHSVREKILASAAVEMD